MDTQALRKARGAFFTPPQISRFIAHWAVRRACDRVLEPSCGEAAFLLPAAERLRDLGAARLSESQLAGVEIHAASAAAAAERLRQAGADPEIVVGDFFDHEPDRPVDAVIGNPPYVRYQSFSGEARAKALQMALAQGVRLTGLASSWAAFTVHAARFLAPEGRLGLVLPAELLSVNYAAEVRRFLLDRFAKVRLVLFEQRVFPGVMEEVVLLLAEGSGGAAAFEVYQARGLDDLARLDTAAWVGFTPRGGEDKWTPALLPSAARDAFRGLTEGPDFAVLLDWGETYLGAVTGNNAYFTLTHAEAAEWDIRPAELLPISPPGARHLRALDFTSAAWQRLADDGKRCLLFRPGARPSAAARRYIAAGEKAKVHLGYKCANRAPWWKVPLVERPDLLLTYMNHDRPRLIANSAEVQLLNSLYGVKLHADRRALGRALLAAACLNSVTLLGAEMVGRAYGGGLLKHEPKEADLLPVPAPATLDAIAAPLQALLPDLAAHPTKAVTLVDDLLLRRHLGLSPAAVEELRQARATLFQRRLRRARGPRGQ